VFPLFPKEETAMHPSQAQDTSALAQKLQGGRRRQSRQRPDAWREAALVLLRLNLDPAQPLLTSR
jgi:hypothetical protein